MMKRLMLVSWNYLIWAVGSMFAATIAFSLVSFLHTGNSNQRLVSAGVASLLGVAWLTKSILELAQQKGSTPFRQVSQENSLCHYPSSDLKLGYLADLAMTDDPRSQYICLTLNRDWSAQKSFLTHVLQRADRKHSVRKAKFRKFPFQQKSPETLVRNIRAHQDILRSHGIYHIQVRKQSPLAVNWEVFDSETDRDKITVLVLVCGPEAVSTKYIDWESEHIERACDQDFVEIIGLKDSVRSIKKLPAPPMLLADDEAIGVF